MKTVYSIKMEIMSTVAGVCIAYNTPNSVHEHMHTATPPLLAKLALYYVLYSQQLAYK